MALFLLAIIAGMLTVLAPCILPLLPVIIGGSVGDKDSHPNRPYIVAGSLAVSLLVFTLLLKVSTAFIGIPPKALAYASGGIIIGLGVVSLFPKAWDRLIGRLGLQARSQRLLSRGNKNKSGIVGPILTGAALGPVFSSCSPTYAFILATVLPRSFASGLIYLVAYCIGLVLVLLLVGVYGQRFISRFSWATNPEGWFKRAIAILFILVGLAVVSGLDKKIEVWLVSHLPSITSLEQKLFERNVNSTSSLQSSRAIDSTKADQLLNVPAAPAPELVGIQSWISSNPLTLKQLKGKVVLIDFWTYSCINCVRTLPYLEKWQETYQDKGFTVLGIHAPEFAFEHDEKNVRAAVVEHKLTYPVGLDNDFSTWKAYDNQFWPAEYLIDRDGNLRRTHFGEGKYEETEAAIQLLLGQKGAIQAGADLTPRRFDQTPETYFGSARAQNYVGQPSLAQGPGQYNASSNLATNQWTLSGGWTADPEKISSTRSNSKLRFKFKSKSVYLVASIDSGSASVGLELDGGAGFGPDVHDGQLAVSKSSLYQIVNLSAFGDQELTLTVPAGVSLHAVTFGS